MFTAGDDWLSQSHELSRLVMSGYNAGLSTTHGPSLEHSVILPHMNRTGPHILVLCLGDLLAVSRNTKQTRHIDEISTVSLLFKAARFSTKKVCKFGALNRVFLDFTGTKYSSITPLNTKLDFLFHNINPLLLRPHGPRQVSAVQATSNLERRLILHPKLFRPTKESPAPAPFRQ